VYSEWQYKTRAALLWLQVLPVNGTVCCKIQYSLAACCRMFLFVINYCCDVFRPQILAIFRELEILSTCTPNVSTYVAEILGWTPSVLSWLSLLSSVSGGKYCGSTWYWRPGFQWNHLYCFAVNHTVRSCSSCIRCWRRHWTIKLISS